MYRTEEGAGLAARHDRVRSEQVRYRPISRRLKRLLDILGALAFIGLFWWLFLIVGLAVRASMGGPVIYRHERVGLHGRRFQCLKFRSMIRNSDKVLTEFLATQPAAREEWDRSFKLQDDPRVTRFGAFIRRTCLDELPQFFNVLRGDMSLVGPRPVTAKELSQYYGAQTRHYITMRPGLTGPWQTRGRQQLTYDARVAMDVQYVHHWSVVDDVLILLRTLKVVFLGDSAVQQS